MIQLLEKILIQNKERTMENKKKAKKKESAKDVNLAFEILAAHEQDLSSIDSKLEEMNGILEKIKSRLGL